MKKNNHFLFHDHDIFLVPSDKNTYLLYAPTIRKLLRITDRLTSQIKKIGLSSLTNDEELNTLIKLLEKSLKNEIKPFPMHLRKAKSFHLALGLTKNCTLKCLYCHADAGKNEEMSIEILFGAILHAFETARNNNLKAVNISFAVGGEATTNWELFTDCIEKIKEVKRKYNITTYLSMTTNGYYGSNKRKYIANNFDNILISLDGPPNIQNFHRPTKEEKKSYLLVKNSAHYFGKNVRSFAIRATISNLTVKKLPELVEFYFREFGNKYRLVFEPLIPLGRGASADIRILEPTQQDYVKYFIAARELAKKLRIDLITSATNHKRLVTSFCGAMSIPSFIVTTDGIVTTCERDSEGINYWYGKYSSYSKKFIIDDQRKLKNKSLLNMPHKCNKCFCKWHCAGDCPDVRTINYNRCYVNKKLTQYELECILSESNNKLAKEVIK